MSIKRNWKLAMALGCGAMPGVGHAKLELLPYVAAGAEYDDNVFRTRDADEAETQRGDRKQSDTVMRYEGGFTSTYTQGLQSLALNASANKSEYDHFDQLDYTGHDLNGLLNWQLGSLVKGDLSASDQRYLQGFDNTTDTNGRSTIDRTEGNLTVRLKIFQDYELRPKAGALRERYSREASKQQNLDEDRYGLALSYIGRGTISIGVEGLYNKGDFIRRDPQPGSVEDYDQTTVQLFGRWVPTAVTALDYAIGSSRRDNNGIGVSNDSAMVGSLNIARTVSVKTNLNVGAYRAITSAEREGESTVISTGIYFGGSWNATQFITVNGNVSYGWDNFQNSVFTDGDREDKVKSLRLSATYAPREWISVTPNVGWEDRTSQLSSEEYDAFQAGLQLKLTFPIR